ncbi:MAG: metalloregulator ArsR/SmtB family transcription factor [Phycisphaerales bacterium]|nr:metalloregulator ArsR/SmtB family transcription factor [Phycisphaerales bacterium]
MSTQARKRKSAPAAACCSCLGDVLEPWFFKALCDPSRLALLCGLAECDRPRTVKEIAAFCPTDLSVVSRHLALLRDAGILKYQRKGREVYYAVDCAAVASRLRRIAGALEVCCSSEGTRKPKKRKEKPR